MSSTAMGSGDLANVQSEPPLPNEEWVPLWGPFSFSSPVFARSAATKQSSAPMRSIGIKTPRPTERRPNRRERFGTNAVRPQGRQQDVAGQPAKANPAPATKNEKSRSQRGRLFLQLRLRAPCECGRLSHHSGHLGTAKYAAACDTHRARYRRLGEMHGRNELHACSRDHAR